MPAYGQFEEISSRPLRMRRRGRARRLALHASAISTPPAASAVHETGPVEPAPELGDMVVVGTVTA
ncbi:MAG: hypothetical protein DLM64_07315 [Solirubrobacterales bacterium]|nr:MAG: hypothetical protein DLM64_07315 [Solirubrobacterales bacterium]